jgi:hypothetical protein
MLSPILEKLTTDANVKSGSGLPLDLVTVDTDAQIELAQQYKVSTHIIDSWHVPSNITAACRSDLCRR